MAKGLGNLKMRSGRIFQPSRKATAAGLSLAAPSGAPLFAQAVRVAISASERWRSLVKCPYLGSANQGGIFLLRTATLMALAQGRVPSYVRNGMGPISPGRWHTWHSRCRMGKTSLLNVTELSAAKTVELKM